METMTFEQQEAARRERLSMSRIRCFFSGHIWRIEEIFRDQDHIFCTSKCSRCGKQITADLSPTIYTYGHKP